MRLIDADALKAIYDRNSITEKVTVADKSIMQHLIDAPTIDAVVSPCKIGQRVWAIRNFKGVKHAESGIVSDMFFTQQMKLQIVVKFVARGEWGKDVFATREEAEAALEERMKKDA